MVDPGVGIGVIHPFVSVLGPQELVPQVFAVLLEYLESPDSSPTVQGLGSGRQAELVLLPAGLLEWAFAWACRAAAQSELCWQVAAWGWGSAPGVGEAYTRGVS